MTLEQRHARKLIDDSYRELARPRCRECDALFTPTSETQNYCGGDCALRALDRRDRAKALREAQEVT